MVVVQPALCWDSKEMELFDLVEEINENFYQVMGISQVRKVVMVIVGVCLYVCVWVWGRDILLFSSSFPSSSSSRG